MNVTSDDVRAIATTLSSSSTATSHRHRHRHRRLPWPSGPGPEPSRPKLSQRPARKATGKAAAPRTRQQAAARSRGSSSPTLRVFSSQRFSARGPEQARGFSVQALSFPSSFSLGHVDGCDLVGTVAVDAETPSELPILRVYLDHEAVADRSRLLDVGQQAFKIVFLVAAVEDDGFPLLHQRPHGKPARTTISAMAQTAKRVAEISRVIKDQTKLRIRKTRAKTWTMKSADISPASRSRQGSAGRRRSRR